MNIHYRRICRICPIGLIRQIGLILLVAFVAVGCASIGHPEGGPRDEKPPVLLRSNPRNGTTAFRGNKVELVFDENIKLDEPSKKIIVSPAQLQMPQISSNGRRVTIELRDTLQPDATYTVDLSDAVRDLNEGNILDGLAIDFTTGTLIDSMRISGTVLMAENLEPAQGIIVGAWRDSLWTDTTLRKVPMERVSRTDQYGRFTIRGLRPEPYRVVALGDMNNDYRWDPSEDIALLAQAVTPSTEAIEVSDTLRSAQGTDSIVTRQGMRYLPNDLLLSMFNEHYSPQYIKDYKRPERAKLTLVMSTTPDSVPELTIVKGPHAGQRLEPYTRIEGRQTRDSLVYWLHDADLRLADSLSMAVRYMKTDSTGHQQWTLDTLKYNFRAPKEKKKKKDDEDTEPETVFMTLSLAVSGPQDLNEPLRLRASAPIDTVAPRGLRLEMLSDTLWVPLPAVRLRPDSLDALSYSLNPPGHWEEASKYRVVIDSAAIRSVLDEPINAAKIEISTRAVADYSSVIMRLQGLEPGVRAMVQLLDGSDKPKYTAEADTLGVATFKWLQPGTYYARAWIDARPNGQWDTGNVADSLAPEDVYYYPKKLTLRANWDIDQTWQLDELAVDAQKPLAVKRNKPKLRDASQQRTDEDEEEDEDLNNNFYTPDGRYQGLPQNQYDRTRRGTGRQRTGGFQRATR